MTNPFLLIVNPAEAITAARRMECLKLPCRRRSLVIHAEKTQDEDHPDRELDEILAEIEERQRDAGYSAMMEKIISDAPESLITATVDSSAGGIA